MILLFLTPWLGSAEEVYRSVNARGQVMFTDTPPPDQSVEVIELPPGPSERSVREAEAREEALRMQLESMSQEREERQRINASKAEAAKQALKTAEEDLAEAREVQDGDWQMTTTGKRHLKQEYFDRIEQAEAAVDAARMSLQEVKSGR
jgi:hypothetical protein